MLDFIRGIVRPTVTWMSVGAVILMLFTGIQVPEWFQLMTGVIVGFWFGQRDRERE